MPTYDYECRRCGNRFEKFQGITEKPLQKCPKCRGKVDRLPGKGAGLLFKGAGFYATDYRSPGYHKAAKAEKGGAAKTGSGDAATKSDPKK